MPAISLWRGYTRSSASRAMPPHPLEAWVATNPIRNDSSQTRTMISSYKAKGNCKDIGKEETFPISRPNSVVKLLVVVNGVQGTFILDTGATFVSIRRSFAEKAKVRIDEESKLQLSTANGMTEAKRAQATTVQVRSLQANDVPVVVQADEKGSYGQGVDGLLGMSFLSRFNLTIDGRQIKLSSRSK